MDERDALDRIADALERIANQMERDGRSPLPSPVEPPRGDRWPLGPYTDPNPRPKKTWLDWADHPLYSNDTDAEP